MSEQVLLSEKAKDILGDLASGWTIVVDNSNEPHLVQEAPLDAAAFAELLNFTPFLKSFANNGGYWISDTGRKAYIKSTDELGDGKIYRSSTFLT